MLFFRCNIVSLLFRPGRRKWWAGRISHLYCPLSPNPPGFLSRLVKLKEYNQAASHGLRGLLLSNCPLHCCYSTFPPLRSFFYHLVFPILHSSLLPYPFFPSPLFLLMPRLLLSHLFSPLHQLFLLTPSTFLPCSLTISISPFVHHSPFSSSFLCRSPTFLSLSPRFLLLVSSLLRP